MEPMKRMIVRVVQTAAVAVVLLPATSSAQTTAPAQAAQSVTFSIDDAATKFNSAVRDGLSQRLAELQSTLKDASARVHAALERAQREQTEEANNAYEMTISGELLHVQTALQAIVGEQGSVLGAQRELTQRLEGIRSVLTKDEATYSREAKEKQALIANMASQLDALADKYRANIESGATLTPDEDLRVRDLADRLKLAEQDAALTDRAAAESSTRVARLRDFDGRLSAAGGEFSLLFNRASGQVALLGRVADMRKKGIEVAAVITQLNNVSQQMDAVDAVLREASNTFDELLVAPSLTDTGTAAIVPQTPRRSGLDVLKDVLQKRGERARGGGR